MKTFRSLSCLAGVCLVLFMIASPANSATTAKPATSPVPVSVLDCPQGPPTPGLIPQYGGIMKINQPNNPNNIGQNWAVTNSADTLMNRFAMENLIGCDPKGNAAPQLATSWKSDPANKTIILTLRQGVKFHDGTDFNAAAVKWNLDMYRKGPKPELKPVKAVDVIDDYHVRLTLDPWDPFFLTDSLSNAVGRMTSPTAAQKLGDELRNHPVGTGPFKFVSYQPNVSLKYARWEGYWQKGLPYLDGVEINFVTDPVVSLMAFTKGETHAVFNISVEDAARLKAEGNIIDSNTIAIRTIAGDSKNKTSPFADIRVRRAIAHAIDNKPIVDSVFRGFSAAANQLAETGGTAYNPAIKGYPYNPDKARELLASAGYTSANPLTTKLVFASNPQISDMYVTIQGYLKNVGINLSLEPIDMAGFNQLQTSGWKNHLLDCSFSYNGLELKYSKAVSMILSAGQYRFVSVWTPDDYNALVKAMLADPDLNKREEYYRAINKMAVDDYSLIVPLVVQRLHCVKSPKLHDYGQQNRANEFLPERAWLGK